MFYKCTYIYIQTWSSKIHTCIHTYIHTDTYWQTVCAIHNGLPSRYINVWWCEVICTVISLPEDPLIPFETKTSRICSSPIGALCYFLTTVESIIIGWLGRHNPSMRTSFLRANCWVVYPSPWYRLPQSMEHNKGVMIYNIIVPMLACWTRFSILMGFI